MTSHGTITLKGGRRDNRSRPSAVSPAPTTISRRFREHHGVPPSEYPPEDRGGDEAKPATRRPGARRSSGFEVERLPPPSQEWQRSRTR